MLLTEVPHPRFLELLRASDADLMPRDLRDLEQQLGRAQTFQDEGLWSDALMDYIQAAGEDQYVHLHWTAERHYADQLRDPNQAHNFGYYYLVGYARIVSLVLRYHDNMGYVPNDFYFVRGFLEHTFGGDKAINILEIGAGSGKLIADLGQHGYRNIEGMEMAAAALREARANVAGIFDPHDVIHAMSFQDFRKRYPQRQYDVVVHAHLIEHIPPSQTESFLKAVHATLKPDGWMVVITPSRLSGPHDVTRYFRPGGSDPEGFHLWEFTLHDLEDVLTRSGFGKLATVRSLPILNYWWDGIPTEANFKYKRDMEIFLMSMNWEQRKPIVDGMYYTGMVCQKI